MKSRPLFILILLAFLFVSLSERTSNSASIEDVELVKNLSDHPVAGLPPDAPRPVFYHLPNAFAPSCGLVTVGEKEITPILEVEPGESFPQCLEVVDGGKFKFRNKTNYVFKYRQRDTKEDTSIAYFFVQEQKHGLRPLDVLNHATPPQNLSTKDVAVWAESMLQTRNEPPGKELLYIEPVFGITYLPSKIHFDPAPAEVFLCTGLLQERRKLWVFGQHKKGKVAFYYVYGLIEVDFGAGPTGEFEAENDDGIIVAVAPEGCKETGAGYALSSDPKDRKMAADIGITDDVLSALISDVISREVKAFGGVDKFLDKVKEAGVPETSLEPLVRAKLHALKEQRGRKAPPPKGGGNT